MATYEAHTGYDTLKLFARNRANALKQKVMAFTDDSARFFLSFRQH